MAHQEIWKLCHVCIGTGESLSPPIFDEDGNKISGEVMESCPQCTGTGRILWGYLNIG